jgi:hypothetical protein
MLPAKRNSIGSEPIEPLTEETLPYYRPRGNGAAFNFSLVNVNRPMDQSAIGDQSEQANSSIARVSGRRTHFTRIKTMPQKRIQTKNGARNHPLALSVTCFLAIGAITGIFWNQANAQSEPSSLSDASASTMNPESERRNIWQDGVGEGFRSTTQSIGLSSGATYGLAAFGGREAHHLALISLSYGHMLGHLWGEGLISDNVALSVEARYVHWSCAGLHHPNLGLNGVTGMAGVTFFF